MSVGDKLILLQYLPCDGSFIPDEINAQHIKFVSRTSHGHCARANLLTSSSFTWVSIIYYSHVFLITPSKR